MAELVAVNVVHAIIPGHRRDTAIDKRPVPGPITVSELGLAGDQQCDVRFHGGPDKAVYAYAEEDNAWWSAKLDRPIPPGTFGENLTTTGLDIGRARIGEVWAIGSTVTVEVRSPRTPCANLSARMGLPRFHHRFNRAGRVGAYLKVRRTGTIGAGDPIRIVERPDHGVDIIVWNHPTAEQAAALLDSGIEVAETVRREAERVIERAGSAPVDR